MLQQAGGPLALIAAAGACAADPLPCGGKGDAAAIRRGLRRGAETMAAMRVLRLPDSDVHLLGYPNMGLGAVAVAVTPFTDDPSGLHRTYAEDGDGDPATCDGDFGHRLSGRHSPLTAQALAADLDALLALARPSDVYTHAGFDGHPDHRAVAAAVEAALARSGLAGTVHATLIHPEGSDACMGPSAREWPGPPDAGDDPLARFTPALAIGPPPLPPCGTGSRQASWGAAGPPDERVPVPEAMRRLRPEENLKWQVLARYRSQIDCARDASGRRHPSCGYLRAFVKRDEIFWTRPFGAGQAAPGAVLVVAAHPDDEALGAAGVIAAARASGRRVVVAVVTNGDSAGGRPRAPAAPSASSSPTRGPRRSRSRPGRSHRRPRRARSAR
jgi:LmbE family N-acetylglucosaminyl deacetylase